MTYYLAKLIQPIVGCLTGYAEGSPQHPTESEHAQIGCNFLAVSCETASLLGAIELVDPSMMRACCVICLPNMLALPGRSIDIHGLHPTNRFTTRVIINPSEESLIQIQPRQAVAIPQGKLLLTGPRRIDQLTEVASRCIPEARLTQACVLGSAVSATLLASQATCMLVPAVTSHLYGCCCSSCACLPSLACLKTSTISAGLCLRAADCASNLHYYDGLKRKIIIFESDLPELGGIQLQLGDQPPITVGNKALSLCLQKLNKINSEKTALPSREGMQAVMRFFQLIQSGNCQEIMINLAESVKDSHYPLSAKMKDLKPDDFKKFERALLAQPVPVKTPLKSVVTAQPRMVVSDDCPDLSSNSKYSKRSNDDAADIIAVATTLAEDKVRRRRVASIDLQASES